jgi:hypothetical protein
VQYWYGHILQDETNNPVKVVYSLTVNYLNTWHWKKLVQLFGTNSSSLTVPTTTPVSSPSQASPSFQNSIMINILEFQSPRMRINGTASTASCIQPLLVMIQLMYLIPLITQGGKIKPPLFRNKGSCSMAFPIL